MSEADGVPNSPERKTLTTRTGVLLFAGGMVTWALISFCWSRTALAGSSLVSIKSKDGCHLSGWIPFSGSGSEVSYLLRPGIYELTPRRGEGRSAPLVVYGGDMDVTIKGEGCRPAISPTLYEEAEKHGRAEVVIISS